MTYKEQIMTELTYLSVDKLHPHPDNPRKDLGDLTELTDSIKANGVFQNLTVVPEGDGYTIIIGHRRCAAAKAAGLTEVPCIVTEMSEREQLQTMLLENMQRSDLTVYEQAQGFQMMLNMGDTVDDIAEKSGFSATTVRRRVKMMELDQTTLKEVSERQLSITDFDRLAQIEDIGARNKCLKEIGTSGFNQAVTSQMRKQNIKKRLPLVKNILKGAKAKEIRSSECYSSKYDQVGPYIYIHDWDESTELVPSKIKGQVYYYLDKDYGSLRFYAAHEKAKPVKKSAAELERQKRIDAAWEKAKELAAVSYKMRSEFIGGISLNPKNSTAILKGAVSSSILRCIDYVSPDRDLIVKTLAVDDARYSSKRAEIAMQAFERIGAKGYPMLIYANFGDGKDNSYITGYKGEWPKYEKSARLDAIYAWLCSLGYEMSDDEKALQNGTHELFKEEHTGKL